MDSLEQGKKLIKDKIPLISKKQKIFLIGLKVT